MKVAIDLFFPDSSPGLISTDAEVFVYIISF